MFELRQKYYDLLNIMREQYGADIAFSSEEFGPRLMALIYLFQVYGVFDRQLFAEKLAYEWKWEHYCKVIRELKELGIIDEDNKLNEKESENALKELIKIY